MWQIVRRRWRKFLLQATIKKLLIKNNISAKENLRSHRIPEPIAFGIIAIAQKIAEMAFGIQFGTLLFLNVGVRVTPKDYEMIQRGFKTMPESKRGISRNQATTSKVECIDNRVTGFSPKIRRKLTSVKERVYTFHDCSIIALTKTIMLRGIGCIDFVSNTLLRKVFFKFLAGEFPTTICAIFFCKWLLVSRKMSW